MANALYAVVIDGNQWRISHNGQLFDRYPTEATAVAAARTTAEAAVAAGFETRVVVETVNGGFRVEWNSADAAA
jgi:hypothetical protein